MNQPKIMTCLAALAFAAIISGNVMAREPRFPQKLWEKTFSDEVQDVVMAPRTGAAAVSTNNEVYYFGDDKQPMWTAGKGQGWQLVDDLGINWDGTRVFFQTDQKPKGHMEGRDFTMHMLDGSGAELWARPNPMRYQNAIFSPSGNYILVGEATQVGVSCFNQDLAPVWKKDIRYWRLVFDPLEHYLFDGEGGVLYRVIGEQVWEFGSSTQINSMSDDARVLLTQLYRTVKAGQRMFLTDREALKKIELPGAGGTLSADGSLTAIVGLDQQLSVYNTNDLFAVPASAPALFRTPFTKAWVIHISNDKQTLFVMGVLDKNKSVMMLVNLAAGQVAWSKEVDPKMRLAIPTDDNRIVVIKPDNKTVARYLSY